jgi:hypothetical protein
MGFYLIIRFIDNLYIHKTVYTQYSVIADLPTLQFTVTHALRLAVVISRILATDLQQSHCQLQIAHEVFFLQPNFFLSIILQLSIPKTRLSSIPLFPSSYPGRLASRNPTLHYLFVLNTPLQSLCTDHAEKNSLYR